MSGRQTLSHSKLFCGLTSTASRSFVDDRGYLKEHLHAHTHSDGKHLSQPSHNLACLSALQRPTRFPAACTTAASFQSRCCQPQTYTYMFRALRPPQEIKGPRGIPVRWQSLTSPN